MNPELENYLRDCKLKNIPFDQIQNNLLSSGYPSEVIEQARNIYTPPLISSLANASAIANYNNPPEQPAKKSFDRPIIFLLLLLFFILLLSISFYAIATNKIKLPTPNLQQKISSVYYSLPFVSMSPQVLIEQSALNHQKVLKNSFDLSLSVNGLSGSTVSFLGSSNLDFSIKGYADYTEKENPKANLSFLMGKDLNVEVRKKDNILYIQIPKIPPAIYLMLGLEPEKMNPLLENWIAIDTTPLKTEASKKISEMNEETQSQSQTQKSTEEILKKLLNEKILPLVTMTSETLDNSSVYKISLKPTPDQLDSIIESLNEANRPKSTSQVAAYPSTYKPPKPSEYIKDLEILVYIGKKDSYVQRLDTSFRIDPTTLNSPSSYSMPIPNISSQTTPISIAGVLKLSDYGKDLPIETPSKSLTQEEFLQKFSETQPGGIFGSINPGEQINRGKDTGSRSDAEQVIGAIDRYYVVKQIYPWQTDNTAKTAIPNLKAINDLWLQNPSLSENQEAKSVLQLLDGRAPEGSPELKTTFITRINEGVSYNTLHIYSQGSTSGDSFYVCFQPKSTTFKTEASKRCSTDLPEDLKPISDQICNVSSPWSCLP